jgi:hypothetical protein
MAYQLPSWAVTRRTAQGPEVFYNGQWMPVSQAQSGLEYYGEQLPTNLAMRPQDFDQGAAAGQYFLGGLPSEMQGRTLFSNSPGNMVGWNIAPDQLGRALNDWNTFFEQSPVGNAIDWNGGQMVNLGGGKAKLIDPNGRVQEFSQGLGPGGLAGTNEFYRDNWGTPYGATIPGYTPHDWPGDPGVDWNLPGTNPDTDTPVAPLPGGFIPPPARGGHPGADRPLPMGGLQAAYNWIHDTPAGAPTSTDPYYSYGQGPQQVMYGGVNNLATVLGGLTPNRNTTV